MELKSGKHWHCRPLSSIPEMSLLSLASSSPARNTKLLISPIRNPTLKYVGITNPINFLNFYHLDYISKNQSLS